MTKRTGTRESPCSGGCKRDLGHGRKPHKRRGGSYVRGYHLQSEGIDWTDINRWRASPPQAIGCR